MKKVILSLLIVAGLAWSTGANAQVQARIGFYYYPQSNVYYNPHTREYAYDDNGNWAYRRTLPSNVVVRNQSHVMVYGDRDIWRDNDAHRNKYKDWDKRHKKKVVVVRHHH